MDTSSYEDQFATFSDTFKKSALPILIVSALLTVGLGLHLVTSPPEFRTDLNDFQTNPAHCSFTLQEVTMGTSLALTRSRI